MSITIQPLIQPSSVSLAVKVVDSDSFSSDIKVAESDDEMFMLLLLECVRLKAERNFAIQDLDAIRSSIV